MRLSLGIGLGLGARRGVPGYAFANSEASALVARMTVQPANGRKALIDSLVGSLKSAGVWSKMDCLYVVAAHDAQAARLNWVGSSYTLTPVNSPGFVADRGYTGDGSTSLLESNYNPTTAAGAYALNSAHIGSWARTNVAATVSDIGNANSRIFARTSADAFSGRLNTTTGPALAPSATTSVGHSVLSRLGSTTYGLYRDGTATAGNGSTSEAVLNATFQVLASNTGAFSSRQIACAHWGSGLSAAEIVALYSSLNTYFQAIGAA